MKAINTRDLAHRAKEIRRALELGESLEWKSRGRTIAVLEPVHKEPPVRKNHWLERAKRAGAAPSGETMVSQRIYDERG